MTKFLKGSALIACLLSSFAMTAIAGPGDDQGHKKLATDLFDTIVKKKASSDPKQKAAGEKAEKLICSKISRHCAGDKLVNKNVGDDLNNDMSPEAKTVFKSLLSIPGLVDVNLN
jgi:ABC-type transporter MlaC component